MKRLGWIGFILLLIYFIFTIRQDIIVNLESRKEQQRLMAKLQQEEQNAVKLADRLKRLNSNELIEELARTKLELIKKGEIAYKVVR